MSLDELLVVTSAWREQAVRFIEQASKRDARLTAEERRTLLDLERVLVQREASTAGGSWIAIRCDGPEAAAGGLFARAGVLLGRAIQRSAPSQHGAVPGGKHDPPAIVGERLERRAEGLRDRRLT
jgi:hypothetical protein